MRTAITIGLGHGQKTFVLLAGPEVPILSQVQKFKDMRRSMTNPKFARVEFREDGQKSRAVTFEKESKTKE